MPQAEVLQQVLTLVAVAAVAYYSGGLYQKETRLWRHNLKRAQLELQDATSAVAQSQDTFSGLRDKVFDRQVEALAIIETRHSILDAKGALATPSGGVPSQAPHLAVVSTPTSVISSTIVLPMNLLPGKALTNTLWTPLTLSCRTTGAERQPSVRSAAARQQNIAHLRHGGRCRGSWPSRSGNGVEKLGVEIPAQVCRIQPRSALVRQGR